MKRKETIKLMAESLVEQAIQNNVDLSGMTEDNFNGYLDDAFDDGGQVRCERFCDLGWEYAAKFGELGSDGFDAAMWRVIPDVIKMAVRLCRKQAGQSK